MTAIRRPLKLDAKVLKEFSDIELDQLSYFIRKAYANLIYSEYSLTGKISLSNIGSTIGNIVDVKRNQVIAPDPEPDVNTNPPNPDNQETDFQEPAYSYSNTTFTYYQKDIMPNYDLSTYNRSSYVSFQNKNFHITGDVLEIYETVIKDTITQMKTGDEVGTYRVATSTPSGGVWKNVYPSFFVDTKYDTETAYNLYIKTAESVDDGIKYSKIYNPIYFDKDNRQLRETNISVDNPENNNIIRDVLIDVLQRNYIQYEIGTTDLGINRGVVLDTWYSNDTFSAVLQGGAYTGFFTPSGALNTTTNYFYISN